MPPRQGVDDRASFIGHDHPLERQQPIHPRRRQAGLGCDFARNLDRAGQRRSIHHEAARGFLRLDGQRNLKGAAQESLGGEPPRRRLQPVIAGRRAQPQIEAAAIDALGFPAPAQAVMAARAFGKTCHADKGHAAAPEART